MFVSDNHVIVSNIEQNHGKTGVKGTVNCFWRAEQWVAHSDIKTFIPFFGNATLFLINLLHLLQQINKENMSLVKPEDFAKALNISYGTIRSKLSRGGLLRNKNKLIDTEHPTNFSYLLEINGGDQSVFDGYAIKPIGRTNVHKKSSLPNKKQTKVSVSEIKVENDVNSTVKQKKVVSEKPSKIKGSVNIAPAVETKETRVKLSAEEIRERDEQRRHNKELKDYDTRKKRADAEYRERESELKRMQLEKLAGNTLPLDIVNKLIVINCQAILVQFMSSLENMVAITVEELGGNRSDNVRITNRLKTEFKKTVDNCRKNAERECENAVAEYSEVRSRGERKA